MKWYLMLLIKCLLLCLLLSACSGGGSGPQTWIDLPLNNATAPMAPVTLMAHSSDISGVKQIEFFVNGEEIAAPKTDGNRLESRSQEWTPTEPGEYKIQARGISNTGEKGSFATAWVTILDLVPDDQVQIPPQVTASVSPTTTETATHTPTETSTIHPTITASFTPTSTNTPKAEVIEPPVIEIDTTDPEVLSVSASPDPIYHEVCGSSFDLVVRLTVHASDNVAIDHVGGTWSIGGDSGNYILDPVGGSQYQKDFGPFSALGPLYFVGSAEDTSGNWTYYEAWVTIKNCVE